MAGCLRGWLGQSWHRQHRRSNPDLPMANRRSSLASFHGFFSSRLRPVHPRAAVLGRPPDFPGRGGSWIAEQCRAGAGQSQPTVARRMRVLEDLLGVALFERGPNSLTLTEAGRAILEAAAPMAEAADAVPRLAAAFRPDSAAPVRITATMSMTMFLSVSRGRIRPGHRADNDRVSAEPPAAAILPPARPISRFGCAISRTATISSPASLGRMAFAVYARSADVSTVIVPPEDPHLSAAGSPHRAAMRKAGPSRRGSAICQSGIRRRDPASAPRCCPAGLAIRIRDLIRVLDLADRHGGGRLARDAPPQPQPAAGPAGGGCDHGSVQERSRTRWREFGNLPHAEDDALRPLARRGSGLRRSRLGRARIAERVRQHLLHHSRQRLLVQIAPQGPAHIAPAPAFRAAPSRATPSIRAGNA